MKKGREKKGVKYRNREKELFEIDNIEKKFMEKERKGERKNKETRRRCSKSKWCILKKRKKN